jgi:hypothetical protein
MGMIRKIGLDGVLLRSAEALLHFSMANFGNNLIE